MNIRGISHMAMRTKDIEASLDFYARGLGLREMFRLHRDGTLWLVYLCINDTTYLELFPDGEGERAPGKMEVGYNHLCLEVDNIEHTIAHLEGEGVPLTSPLQTGDDGNRQAWVEDPDGHRIEFMEMALDSLQYQAIVRLRRES